MSDLHSVFIEEATDLLDDLETALLALESSYGDQAAVEQVFRVMHTLKGNSSMFGFQKMGEFTHHLENIYDLIRNGALSVDPAILTLTLECTDLLKSMLGDPELKDAALQAQYQSLMSQVVAYSDTEGASPVEELLVETASTVENQSTYYIFFKPDEGIFKSGTNPLYLIEDLSNLGQSRAFAALQDIPEWDALDASNCYVSWHIFLSTEEAEDSLREVFLFVEDECRVEIIPLAQQNLLACEHLSEAIEKLDYQGDPLSEEDLMQLTDHLLSGLADEPATETETVVTTDSAASTGKKEQMISSVRVASDKLDALMNMVSELVTTQARLSLLAENSHNPELISVAEEVEKVSRRLRDNTFSIALIPVENILVRFRRLVRDLSAELGKSIEFITEGTDTELDKTIIESLTDPLLHIIRNSIDHGIEDPESRRQKGKPEKGSLRLKAFYSGNSVVIQVIDDGAGIDPQKVRKKAIEKGLISPEVSLTDAEMLDLIFLPGFSTAEKVSDVSGRGVGMDVVQRKISEIRGEVTLDSRLGEGTTTSIRLPLTLSIIDGLLVKISDTHYVIPLSVVDKCYEVKHHDLVNKFDNVLVLDGVQVPFFYLRDEFEMGGEAPYHEEIIVISYNDKRIGISVDHVVGEYQAVLKPLGRYYQKQDYLSGATILGDGTIALVVDPNKLIKDLSEQLAHQRV
jgi:two-component system chemotaxis sensor kinase CheA